MAKKKEINEKEREERLKNISKRLRINNMLELKTKKNEELADYLTPSPGCDLCCSEMAYTINKAYLEKGDATPLKDLCDRFKKEFKKVTGHQLTPTKLSFHFNQHFNAKGLAAKKYNELVDREKQEKEFTADEPTKAVAVIKPEMKQLFSLLESKYLDDLQLLDFTVRQQLYNFKRIKEIEAKYEETNSNDSIAKLIMKSEEILKNVQGIALNKIRTFHSSKLQQAQANALNALSAQSLTALGIDVAVNPKLIKKTQFLFVQTVISHFLKRLGTTLEDMGMEPNFKADFFQRLKDNVVGIEEEIFTEFEETVKDAQVANDEVLKNAKKD